MSENLRVIRFAIIVCLICSLMVSAAAVGLRDRQEANLLLDKRKNILKAVGLLTPGMTESAVNQTYDDSIVGLVINPDGTVVEGRDPADVDPEKEPDLMFVYERVDDGNVTAYTIPVSGKGLWSTLYGYLALDSDLNTVKGLTFYQHGETPGLGGEIEKPWFQENDDENAQMPCLTYLPEKDRVLMLVDPEEGTASNLITESAIRSMYRHYRDVMGL